MPGVAVAVVGRPRAAAHRVLAAVAAALAVLRAAFEAGERAPSKVLPELGVVRVGGLPVRAAGRRRLPRGPPPLR